MRIEIETYKGQTIYYDDNSDKFVCEITKEDNFKTAKRGSLIDLRNEIDSFIKQNLDFKPFVFIETSIYSKELVVKKCESIRKDGTLYILRDGADKFGGFKSVKELTQTAKVYDQKIIDQYREIKEKEQQFNDQIKQELSNLLTQLKPYDFSRIIEAFDEIKNG